MDMRDILIYFAIKYEGDYELIRRAIKDKEKVGLDELNNTLKSVSSNTITFLDDNYPICLKQLYNPPFVLFYYGDITILNKVKSLGVVGTRSPSNYGVEVTNYLLGDLLEKEDVVIVSGLAIGIDSLAHEIALNKNRKTIAVLANGLDEYYIKNNLYLYNRIKENGLILSEYPSNSKVDKSKFRVRNRLIAALSNAVLIPEANIKSGTSITINSAIELNKEILCVPSSILEKDSLTNYLIKEGAKCIFDYKDILDEL